MPRPSFNCLRFSCFLLALHAFPFLLSFLCALPLRRQLFVFCCVRHFSFCFSGLVARRTTRELRSAFRAKKRAEGVWLRRTGQNHSVAHTTGCFFLTCLRSAATQIAQFRLHAPTAIVCGADTCIRSSRTRALSPPAAACCSIASPTVLPSLPSSAARDERPSLPNVCGCLKRTERKRLNPQHQFVNATDINAAAGTTGHL